MKRLFTAVRMGLERRRQRWEALCNRCGLCCYEKDFRAGQLYIRMDSPCRYLDTQTHQCRVYERRFAVCSDCRKLRYFHARFSRWLPDSCGYVRRYRGRRQ